MILILEAIFIHGFLLFMSIFQGLVELSYYLPSYVDRITEQQNEVEEKSTLLGLPMPIEAPAILQLPMPQVTYQVSNITEEQGSFFNDLFDCINSSTTDAEPAVVEEMLTMEAWTEVPEPVAVTEVLAASSNAKIKDHKIGEQIWVVEVIGEEQGFIHVSDGSGRAWIDANDIGTFSRRDILSVLVNRETDIRVKLVAADILQEHSADFSMSDELDSMYFSNSEEIIGA